MGSSIGHLFDGYSRKARLAPAFIVAFPVTLLCVALIPTLVNWNKLWLLAVASGTVILVDQLVRDRGRAIQPGLWGAWGGPPATQALRHSGAKNLTLLARRHQKLATLLDQPMPTKRQELRNPAKADEVYEMAVKYLISQTRDTAQFRLVFLENCHYGFRRNMLGVRSLGLAISIFVCAATVGAVAASYYGLLVWKIGFALVAIVSLALSLFWWKLVNSDWVKSAASDYAERLLEVLDVLPLAPSANVSGDGSGA
ncbi:hypothetical protein [Streptomyces spiralis]|uniref:hypothetical protein n=1 Tax=Streptomyces spiralis TaxID=66376 RepID=UPI003682BE1D